MSSNPVLFITGANTGLGFQTVRSLCRSSKPYTILLGGRSLDKAKAAVEAAQKEYPQTASTLAAVQIDIEDDDSIAKIHDHIEKQYGRIDVLINNAGMYRTQIFIFCRPRRSQPIL